MELITVPEAAKRKGCSRQALWLAVKRGSIDAEKIGRDHLVNVNQKFEDWEPNRLRQEIGRESQKAR